MRNLFVGLLYATAVSGCVDDRRQVSLPEPRTKCEAVTQALTHPAASAETRALAIEIGRANNCFGPGQQQTINHNIRIVR
jgi:hypothetical protein